MWFAGANFKTLPAKISTPSALGKKSLEKSLPASVFGEEKVSRQKVSRPKKSPNADQANGKDGK